MWEFIGRVNNVIFKVVMTLIIVPLCAIALADTIDSYEHPEKYYHTGYYRITETIDEFGNGNPTFKAVGAYDFIEFYPSDVEGSPAHIGDTMTVTFDGANHMVSIKH